MRIGILQCDDLRPEWQSQFGNYPKLIQDLFAETTADFSYSVFQVRAGHFPDTASACDAFLVTGAQWSTYDPHPWIAQLESYLRDLVAGGGRVAGICFGHQIMAQALGGRVEKSDQGWGMGVMSARVLEPLPWMDPPLSEFALIASHQDQVVTLPPDGIRLAGSDFCPNAAFCLPGSVLTFQGHPEFTHAVSRAIIELRREALGEACASRSLASLDQPTDRRIIAHWLRNFFKDGS